MDTAITLQLTIPAGKSPFDTARTLLQVETLVERAQSDLAALGASLVEVAPTTAPRRWHRSEETRLAASTKRRDFWQRMSPEQRAAHTAKARAARWGGTTNGHAA